MTDENDFTDDPDYDDSDDGLQGPKALRERFKAVRDERDTLKRELVFTQSGLPDTPMAKLLKDAYKGDLDPAAIRKFAIEHGVIDADEGGVPKDELDAQERVAALRKEAGKPGSPVDMNFLVRRAAGKA